PAPRPVCFRGAPRRPGRRSVPARAPGRGGRRGRRLAAAAAPWLSHLLIGRPSRQHFSGQRPPSPVWWTPSTKEWTASTSHERLPAMTKMTPLLERNHQFARTSTPPLPARPAHPVFILTCLDHRVDPAIVLGLQLGDAPVIRNAGGRVTQAVIDDIEYLAFLAEQLFGDQVADDLFEVAVVHHTQCGTSFLADPGFRHQAAQATGRPEEALEAAAVADPHATVRADVDRLPTAPPLSRRVSVSGHVYDIPTGRLTAVLAARPPQPADNN